MPNFKRREIVLAILAQPLVAACGGSGGGNKGDATPTPPPTGGGGPTVTDMILVKLSGDPKAPTMTVVLEIKDGKIHGFVTPKDEPFAESSIKELAWGDGCKGYPQNGLQFGVRVPFSNNNTFLGGINPSGKGNLHAILKDGTTLSANNDHVKLVGENGIPVMFKPKDATGGRDFIQYGSVSDDPIVCPGGGMPGPASTVAHEIAFKSDKTMTIKFALDGDKVVNLVIAGQPANLLTSAVKEVVWNDSCFGWHMSDAARGIVVPFNNNITAIGGLNPSGRDGMVTVLAMDGTEYSLNLDPDKTKITGDGVPVLVRDGLIRYGDVDSPSISCVSTKPPAPASAKHRVTITATSGTLSFVPANDQTVITGLFEGGLPTTLAINAVKDIRLYSQCKGWWSATTNGLLGKLVDGTARFAGLPASDSVMISIVDSKGAEFFLDKEKLDATGDGVLVEMINGIIRFGAAVGNPNFSCG